METPVTCHGGFVGGEGLVDDLAFVGAVQRVGEVDAERRAGKIGMDAAADFFVRREADADGAVGDVGGFAASSAPGS